MFHFHPLHIFTIVGSDKTASTERRSKEIEERKRVEGNQIGKRKRGKKRCRGRDIDKQRKGDK